MFKQTGFTMLWEHKKKAAPNNEWVSLILACTDMLWLLFRATAGFLEQHIQRMSGALPCARRRGGT